MVLSAAGKCYGLCLRGLAQAERDGGEVRYGDVSIWRRFLEERDLDPTIVATWSGSARSNIRLIPSETLEKDNTRPWSSKL
jgi:hypothetical protein